METEKNRFLYKLIPPRLTFTQDMTEAERKVMQEHATYWKCLIDDSIAIIFGLDPRGPWGVGIFADVANEYMHVLLVQMIRLSRLVSHSTSLQCPVR